MQGEFVALIDRHIHRQTRQFTTATMRRFLLLPRGVHRPESVIENVIAYAATEADSFRLIKRPVDAEINSTLPVLFFCL